MSSAATCFTPIAAPTGEPVRLSMQRLWLGGRVLPVGARLTVQHVFRSEEKKPLEVIYSFPLPRDAALRSFRITGEGFEAHSELRQTEEAVRAYEQGIANGALSALARQYGDGLINLTVGNIRPKETVTVFLELLTGVELRDDGFRFRFPFTLAPSYHSKMRASVRGDQGELELPSSEFGDVILPGFRRDAGSLHEVGFELDVFHSLPLAEIGSPSHSVRIQHNSDGPARVLLATDKDVPNRDLVLDARFKGSAAQVLSGPTLEGKRNFAAVIPSTLFGSAEPAPRRLVILLDRSGSMGGTPIAQARKAIEACLAVLEEHDQFGLLAFDDRVEAMESSLLSGSRENRDKARAFLSQIDARGGTELSAGFLESARLLNGSGDVLILTDGQVFGSEQILEQARSSGVRLSCLGIGSASQDRLLALLARETGGVSRFVTARERVDVAAVDLFASIGRPVASGLKVPANVQPEPPQAVFAGTPVLLFGELEMSATAASGGAEQKADSAAGSQSVLRELAKGDAESLHITWNGGEIDVPVAAGDADTGATVRLLQGSRLITDWESRYPPEEALAPVERRKQSRVASRLAELSNEYGLASREMSLVAVVKRSGDRAGELPETRVVPVGIAQDTAFDAYFGVQLSRFASPIPSAPAPAPGPIVAMSAMFSAPPKAKAARHALLFKSAMDAAPGIPKKEVAHAETRSVEDDLMDLAAQLETDGGMPGSDLPARAVRSAAALLAFVAAGHTLSTGAFRSHVARLAAFLTSLKGLSAGEAAVIAKVLGAASSGHAPEGDWIRAARQSKAAWDQLSKV